MHVFENIFKKGFLMMNDQPLCKRFYLVFTHDDRGDDGAELRSLDDDELLRLPAVQMAPREFVDNLKEDHLVA